MKKCLCLLGILCALTISQIFRGEESKSSLINADYDVNLQMGLSFSF